MCTFWEWVLIVRKGLGRGRDIIYSGEFLFFFLSLSSHRSSIKSKSNFNKFNRFGSGSKSWMGNGWLWLIKSKSNFNKVRKIGFISLSRELWKGWWWSQNLNQILMRAIGFMALYRESGRGWGWSIKSKSNLNASNWVHGFKSRIVEGLGVINKIY